MSIDGKVKELIEVTDQLNGLVQEETDFLRRSQVSEVVPLQESKAALSQAYATLSGQLQDAQGQIRLIEPALRLSLKEKTEAFHAVAEENKNWLFAAQQVNERVIEAIAEAVLEAESELSVYAENGRMSDKGEKPSVHMSLNQLT